MYTLVLLFTLLLQAITTNGDLHVRSDHSHRQVVKRAAGPPSFGLSPNNLKKGNVAIGFLPGFGETKGPSNATIINKLLPKPMSIVGIYSNAPDLGGIDDKVDEILKQPGDKAVLELALLVPGGFSVVTQSVVNKIASKVAAINKRGVSVWLRYAYEMNGEWYATGEQPAAFKKSWIQVYKAVHKATDKTYMLWSPNSCFGGPNDTCDLDAVHGGWTPYWPGEQYVDLIGLSFYSYGGYDRQNIAATPTFLASMLSKFHTNFAKKYGKYMVLSETAASYAVNLETGSPNSGGNSNFNIKHRWMKLLLASNMHKNFPFLRAFVWFEIVKDENASGDSPVREMDFRCLLGPSKIRDDALKMIGSGV